MDESVEDAHRRYRLSCVQQGDRATQLLDEGIGLALSQRPPSPELTHSIDVPLHLLSRRGDGALNGNRQRGNLARSRTSSGRPPTSGQLPGIDAIPKPVAFTGVVGARDA